MPTPEDLLQKFQKQLKQTFAYLSFFLTENNTKLFEVKIVKHPKDINAETNINEQNKEIIYETKIDEQYKDIEIIDNLVAYTHLDQREYEELKEKLEAIEPFINHGGEEIHSATYDEATKYLEAIQYIDSYIDSYNKDRKTHKPIESAIIGVLKKAQDCLKSPELKKVQDVMKQKIELVNKYNNGTLKGEIEQKKNNYNPDGVKPSIDECLSISIYNTDPDTVFDRLIWLSKYAAKYERLMNMQNVDENAPNDNIYLKTYNRLTKELEKALPDKAMQYAERMFIQNIAVTNRCAQKFNEYESKAPEGIAPNVYANNKIKETTEFTDLWDSGILKGVINTGTVCNALVNIGESLSDYKKLFEVNVEQPDDMLPLEDTLVHDLTESGFDIDKDLNSVVKSYESLLQDSNPKSESFMKMQNSLKAFLNLNHDGSVPEKEYITKLLAAERDSQKYFESHKGHKFTENGAVRRDISKSITDALKKYKEKAPGLKINAVKKGWRNAMFSKPGITQGEKDAIDKLLTGNDFHTRTATLAYMAIEIANANKLDSTKPEVAKYKELIGKIGHSIEIEMKKNNFKLDEAQAKEFKNAVDALSNLGPKKENVKAVNAKVQQQQLM